MTDLSPAAQAVKDAFDSKWAGTRHQALIAALRAAADRLGYCLDGSAYYVISKDELLDIAAELENTSSYCQPDDQ
jgi:hypothetical protein